MKNDNIKIFVPGRLCIFGEHSDWAGEYRLKNKKIEKGYAITALLQEGIYATVKKCDNFSIYDGDKQFSCEMDLNVLEKEVEKNSYYSYICGTTYEILKRFPVGGIEVTITKKTLPEKKGLSSSAAICVLIVRAFNKLYHLGFSVDDEMDFAYRGERHCSKCGKIDQICAYNRQVSLLEFDGNDLFVSPLEVGSDLYFVFADLNYSKDTREILNKLNSCFPFPKNDLEVNAMNYLGIENKKIVKRAIKLFRNGDAFEIGALMNYAQKKFDESLIPICSELEALRLHEILDDEFVKKISYGGKGVGSGGNGSVQFIVDGVDSQKELKEYLENKYGCTTYSLIIKKNSFINKAVIPLAGFGSRMYPFTKSIPKAFLPVLDHDILKPTFMIILEELYDAGVRSVALIIDRENQEIFDNFFSDYEKTDKLNYLNKSYEEKIQRISKMITYIYQDEKLGLGHAVSLCENFVNNQPFILVLGDQICRSNVNLSCLQQLINQFYKTNEMTISVCKTKLCDVDKYGILVGELENSDSVSFKLDKIVEKPSTSEAKNKYYVKRNGRKEYYAVFGQYILTPEIFTVLNKNIKNKKVENGEYQLTSAIDEVSEKNGAYAYIVDGTMYDVGNVQSYMCTMQENR